MNLNDFTSSQLYKDTISLLLEDQNVPEDPDKDILVSKYPSMSLAWQLLLASPTTVEVERAKSRLSKMTTAKEIDLPTKVLNFLVSSRLTLLSSITSYARSPAEVRANKIMRDRDDYHKSKLGGWS